MAGQRSLKPLMGVRIPHSEPEVIIAVWSSLAARQVQCRRRAPQGYPEGRVVQIPLLQPK